MLKPVKTTKWTFRSTAPSGFGVYGYGLKEDSAIADDEATARRIILDCYGKDLDSFVSLVSKQEITLYDPAPNYVQEMRTIRHGGPKDRDDR